MLYLSTLLLYTNIIPAVGIDLIPLAEIIHVNRLYYNAFTCKDVRLLVNVT